VSCHLELLMRREWRYLQFLLTYLFYFVESVASYTRNRLAFLAFANPKLVYKLRSRRHIKLRHCKRFTKHSAFHTGKLWGINAVCSSFCRTCTVCSSFCRTCTVCSSFCRTCTVCSSFCRTCTVCSSFLSHLHRPCIGISLSAQEQSSKDMINYVKT
jgi:hypothetical protein